MQMDTHSSGGVVSRALANGFFQVQLADGALRVCFASTELRQAGTVIREGDRVSVGAEENGIFKGEITRVRPEPRAQREPAPARASLLTRSGPGALKPQDQKIDRSARPGWPTAAECIPQAGDVVY